MPVEPWMEDALNYVKNASSDEILGDFLKMKIKQFDPGAKLEHLSITELLDFASKYGIVSKKNE